MTVLKVCQFGEEVLQTKAIELTPKEIKSPKFRKLALDMLETMYSGNGVGLAAPQVGVSKRIMVIDVSWALNKEAKPMVFINPELIESEGEILSEEGCLSFKDGKGGKIKKTGINLKDVKRFKRVKVKYLDLKAKQHVIEADGDLMSRCLQHEIDHLDGIVLIDRAEDKEEIRNQLIANNFEKNLDKWSGYATN